MELPETLQQRRSLIEMQLLLDAEAEPRMSRSDKLAPISKRLTPDGTLEFHSLTTSLAKFNDQDFQPSRTDVNLHPVMKDVYDVSLLKQISLSAKRKEKSCTLPFGTSTTPEGPDAWKVDQRDFKIFLTTGVQTFCRFGTMKLTSNFPAEYKLSFLRHLAADLNVSKLTSLLNKEVEINM